MRLSERTEHEADVVHHRPDHHQPAQGRGNGKESLSAMLALIQTITIVGILGYELNNILAEKRRTIQM